jgi:hypothetical protein
MEIEAVGMDKDRLFESRNENLLHGRCRSPVRFQRAKRHFLRPDRRIAGQIFVLIEGFAFHQI